MRTDKNWRLLGQGLAVLTLSATLAACGGSSDASSGDRGTASFLVSVTDTSYPHQEATSAFSLVVTSQTFQPSALSFGAETVGMTTVTQLISATNSGSTPLMVSGVAITGMDSADFSQSNDCPGSLVVHQSCHIRVVFSPHLSGLRSASVTLGGSESAAMTGSGLALASAFYVAPAGQGGSDANPGTLVAPFLTLTKAQSAMQASAGATLTTYIRAGIYSPSAITCGISNGPCGLILGSSDSNETWAYYPPDGINSAILDGGASGPSTGLGSIIYLRGGVTGVTIRGLQFQHCDWTCIAANGASHIAIVQNLFHDGYYGGSTTSGWSQPEGGPESSEGAINCEGNCQYWSIVNNAIHDFAGFGVIVEPGQTVGGGSILGLLVSGNVVYNTCTGFADCGAIYCEDQAGGGTCTFTDNFVRDGNPGFAGYAGYGSAYYLDGCASNSTLSGNVATGRNGSMIVFVHGGYDDTISGNLFDLATTATYAVALQTNGSFTCAGSNDMHGNVIAGNAFVSGGGGGGWGIDAIPTQPAIHNNDYFAYAGSVPSHLGINDVTVNDTNPLNVDPALSLCYQVAPSSPLYAVPIVLPPLVMGWGPPGYVIPKGGTPPSYPSPTCN
jgi:hypothetical protein